MSNTNLIDLAGEAVLRPKAFLHRLTGLGLDMGARWQIFFAVVIVSTLGSHLFLMLLDRDGALTGTAPSPLVTGLVQGLVLFVMVVASFVIGRGFGGTGSFADCLLAMSAVQGVMVVFQAVQIVAIALSPLLAELLGFAAILAFLWILGNFLMELHGFKSLAKVALGMIGSLFVLAAIFGLLLGILGLPFTTLGI